MQVPSHKQIIAGVSYDTTTADLIGWVYDTNIVDSDYEGIKRHLMRGADGRFFLFSLFGTMSTRPIGQIIPFTAEDAARWCESNGVNAERIAQVVPSTLIESKELSA
jgi:hypothetical protein